MEEWDSPTEVREQRNQQQVTNKTACNHITMLEYPKLGCMHYTIIYSQTVMFHVHAMHGFPAVRTERACRSCCHARITDTARMHGACRRVILTDLNAWEEEENSNT